MTISSTDRKAGPFVGVGTTTVFPFMFKVFQASDLLIVRADLSGVESNLVLTTDYSVSLNADQDANPGGSITLVSALATGFNLTISSNILALQPVVLTNNGGFYPKVISDALDRLTMLYQQASEQLGRAAKVPLSGIGSLTPSSLVFGVDATGNPQLSALASITTSAVSTFVNSLLGITSAAAFRAAIGGAASGVNTDITSLANVTSIGGNGYSPYSQRNRIINGAMFIDQEHAGAAQTITAGAALAYTVDQFYAYCTGANVTGQQVAGPKANTNRYQFTGASSVTGVGFGTRLEAINTASLAGSTASLSVKLKSSTLTSITWTAYYANTKDTFGTLASPTRTQISTGTFTINSVEATYSTSISIPGAATTGIEIVLTGGALLGSQTLTIGDVQLEPGSVETPFEQRQYGQELALCQRYFQTFGGAANNFGIQGYSSAGGNIAQYIPWIVTMRTFPTVVLPTLALSNTAGIVANNPNQNGVFIIAVATVLGAVSAINTTGGTGTASARL